MKVLLFKSTHKRVIAKLEKKIKELEEEIEFFKMKLPPPDLTAIFDFEGMSAFSIERDLKTRKTIIGYVKETSDGRDTGEWLFDTTDEIHIRLVNEFDQYLRDKYRD